MKKLLLLGLLSSCTLTILAQKTVEEKLAGFFGFYLGPNLFCYRGDDFADESKGKVGYQAGVLYNLPIGNNIYLQPEINVANIGARYEYSYMGNDEKQKISMTYINLVVVGQYHTNAKVYFELGPQVGYLLSAKSKFNDQTDDIKSEVKKAFLGINLGVGYEFNKNWRIGARYIVGLSQMSEDDEQDYKATGGALNVRYTLR